MATITSVSPLPAYFCKTLFAWFIECMMSQTLDVYLIDQFLLLSFIGLLLVELNLRFRPAFQVKKLLLLDWIGRHNRLFTGFTFLPIYSLINLIINSVLPTYGIFNERRWLYFCKSVFRHKFTCCIASLSKKSWSALDTLLQTTATVKFKLLISWRNPWKNK